MLKLHIKILLLIVIATSFIVKIVFAQTESKNIKPIESEYDADWENSEYFGMDIIKSNEDKKSEKQLQSNTEVKKEENITEQNQESKRKANTQNKSSNNKNSKERTSNTYIGFGLTHKTDNYKNNSLHNLFNDKSDFSKNNNEVKNKELNMFIGSDYPIILGKIGLEMGLSYSKDNYFKDNILSNFRNEISSSSYEDIKATIKIPYTIELVNGIDTYISFGAGIKNRYGQYDYSLNIKLADKLKEISKSNHEINITNLFTEYTIGFRYRITKNIGIRLTGTFEQNIKRLDNSKDMLALNIKRDNQNNNIKNVINEIPNTSYSISTSLFVMF